MKLPPFATKQPKESARDQMAQSTTKSIGVEKKVRGYVIKKMPIGAYLRALDQIRRVPEELIEACFPGMSVQEIGALLQSDSRAALQSVLTAVLKGAPDYLLECLSILLGVDKERLENDPTIGLDGLVEMLETWIEVNNLANFWQAVKSLAEKVGASARQSMKNQTVPETSNDSSPQA